MLHIVYSKEATTIFLLEIVQILQKTFPEKVFIFQHDNLEKTESARKFIANVPNGEIILFLGHGASHTLYGPPDEKGNRSIFINSDNFHLFDNKLLFFLACNSQQLIRKIKPKNGIGFGDLPSDWDHIRYLRDVEDPNAYQGITQDNLNAYISLINILIINSTIQFLQGTSSFDSIYYYYRLLLNKEINKLILSRKNEDKALINLLFQMKQEMIFYHS